MPFFAVDEGIDLVCAGKQAFSIALLGFKSGANKAEEVGVHVAQKAA